MRPRRIAGLGLVLLCSLVLAPLAVPAARAAVEPTGPERLWQEFPLGERLQPPRRTVRPARVTTPAAPRAAETGTRGSGVLRVALTIALIVLASASVLSLAGGALLRRAKALNRYYARRQPPEPEPPADEDSLTLRQELRRVMRGMDLAAGEGHSSRAQQPPRLAGDPEAELLEAARHAAEHIRSQATAEALAIRQRAEEAAQELARRAEAEAAEIRAAAKAYAADVRQDADAHAAGRPARAKRTEKPPRAPAKARRARSEENKS